MSMFLLSDRMKNARTLCSQCEHQKYDPEKDAYRCDRLVRLEWGDHTYSYHRLTMLSKSGGECQLFKPKVVTGLE